MKKLLSILLVLLLAPFVSAQVVTSNQGMSAGGVISGCSAVTAILNVVSGAVNCNAALVVNGTVSTAGRSILTIQDTISGSSATSNFLNVTGASPATLSAETSMSLFTLTLDNDASRQNALKAGTSGTGGAGFNTAIYGTSGGTGTFGTGVLGDATGAATTTYGVYGNNQAGTNRIGGWFSLNGSQVATTTALGADNANVAANIFEARDNGTAVFTIADGGTVTATGLVNLNGAAVVPTGQYVQVGDSGGALLWFVAGLTPDAPVLSTGVTSESVHIFQRADSGFDFQNACTTGLGTAACTDPTLIIHSHNQDTGEFLSLAHDGKAGVIAGGDSTSLNGQIRLGGSVALPDTTATTVINVASANTTGTGGTISYTLTANDATNAQERTGQVRYSVATNNAGTTSCAVYGVDNAVTVNPTQTADGSGAGIFTAGAGTLTLAWSVTAGTNTCAIKIGAISSLTETAMRIDYTVLHSGRGAVTGG